MVGWGGVSLSAHRLRAEEKGSERGAGTGTGAEWTERLVPDALTPPCHTRPQRLPPPGSPAGYLPWAPDARASPVLRKTRTPVLIGCLPPQLRIGELLTQRMDPGPGTARARAGFYLL